MKLASVAVAFKEERFIPKYIQVMQDRVDEIVILNSTKPWQGDFNGTDNTASIARSLGATVIEYDWPSEHEQRNAGQEYLSDCDWIIVLDPDEYLLDHDWDKLLECLSDTPADALVTGMQHTYWKRGFVIDPPEDYKQIIAVRPGVRFVDKRVVNCGFALAPTELHHFSWARSNEECLRKISHYAHAHELNKDWYNDVWLSDQLENLHPLTPESLKKAVRVVLPEELERLDLWPQP